LGEAVTGIADIEPDVLRAERIRQASYRGIANAQTKSTPGTFMGQFEKTSLIPSL